MQHYSDSSSLIELASTYFFVSIKDILSNNRNNEVVLARYATYYALHKIFNLNYSDIARIFDKHHTNITYGLSSLEEWMSVYSDIKSKVLNFEKYCREQIECSSVSRDEIIKYIKGKTKNKEALCDEIRKFLSIKYPNCIFYIFPAEKLGPVVIYIYWFEGPSVSDLMELKALETKDYLITDRQVILYREFKQRNRFKIESFLSEHYSDVDYNTLTVLGNMILSTYSFKGLININEVKAINTLPEEPTELVINRDKYILLDYTNEPLVNAESNKVYLSADGINLNVFYNKKNYYWYDKYNELKKKGWKYDSLTRTLINKASNENIDYISSLLSLTEEERKHLKQHTRIVI